MKDGQRQLLKDHEKPYRLNIYLLTYLLHRFTVQKRDLVSCFYNFGILKSVPQLMEFKHCRDFTRLYIKLSSNLSVLYVEKGCQKIGERYSFTIFPYELKYTT